MLAAGTVLDGRYEILGPLGEGGMGAIYRASRPLLGDEVAVKVMRASFDAPSDGRQRFLRESRACAQLRHPNIVTILDFNVDPAGQPYLVMELLSGPSLREELELAGPMSPEDVAAILSPVASALQLAHDRGITHRDLKPANIVSHRYESGDRVYKVIDFGLVSIKNAKADEPLTDPNMFMGTMAYAAPEQIRGDPVEPRSDLYTLGVIVYEMLTGNAPFTGENVTALMYQIVNFAPPAPSAVNPAVPELLNFIVAKMLAKPLEERYQNAQELANDLRNCERQIATPSAITQPLRPLGMGAVSGALAAGAQPELAVQAQSAVLAQTLNRTRSEDSVPTETTDPPARGLAHSFDSAEATQRLAALTGATTTALADSVSATQAMSSLKPPEDRGWRGRDWLLVGGATLLGLLIAAAILRA